MNKISSKNPSYLDFVLQSIKYVGYCVVEDVLDELFLSETRTKMYEVQRKIITELGEERLNNVAKEIGVLRLMMKFDRHFIRLLELPNVLEIVDNTVSKTAILHVQNGFILPSFQSGNTPAVFQNNFHPDFSRYLNGYLCSINMLFAIDSFSKDNGGTLIVPGTHQKELSPSTEYLKNNAISVECSAGSMIVFDSTLWHCAGINNSGRDRLGINHQFTRSYFKQQIDYVRALGEDVINLHEPRTQQLLGYYTRVVTSLDEYYRPEEQRLYKRYQG